MPMNKVEYLMLCLGEESAEVAKEASKCIRFTNGHRHANHTNLERLQIEYSQLLAVIFKLREEGVEIELIPEEFEKKLRNLYDFMDVSRGLGTLEPLEDLPDAGVN